MIPLVEVVRGSLKNVMEIFIEWNIDAAMQLAYSEHWHIFACLETVSTALGQETHQEL